MEFEEKYINLFTDKHAKNTTISAMTNNTDMTDTAIAKALNISLERVRKVRNQTL